MTEPTQKAQNTYTELAPDSEFPAVPLNVSGDQYTLPTKGEGNLLYGEISSIDLDKLTDGNTDGEGTFDKLMASVRAHLEHEYECNRISGEEYTKAYIQLTTAALTTGASFLFQAEQLVHQNRLVQMQARAAEVQAVTAAVQLEEQKQTAVAAQFTALNARAQFAQSKLQLSAVCANILRTEKDIEVAEQQKLQIQAETGAINFRRQEILPQEKRRVAYEVDAVLPAQVAKTEYETQHLLPQQKINLEKDASIKDFQLSSTLVQQFKLLQEQTEVQRAQTLDVRSDNQTVTGAVGRQKELYAQQIDSYRKDSRYKVGKMFLDGWITQKSLDEGLNAPDQLNNTNINEVLVNLRSDNALGS